MPAKEFLQEAMKLHKVSAILDSLAERHGPVSEGLMILAGTVHNSANLLEVLVEIRLGADAASDEPIN